VYGYSCLIYLACKAHASYCIVTSDLPGFTIFAVQIFEEHSNIKFKENPSSGSRVVPLGQTNDQPSRHDEASGLRITSPTIQNFESVDISNVLGVDKGL
jgi:hypothetical protein